MIQNMSKFISCVLFIICLVLLIAQLVHAQAIEESTNTTTTNATTLAPVSTPEITTTLAPLSDEFSIDSEVAARGSLTVLVGLVSPLIGPSALFDVHRALSVFSFARCSHADPYQAHRASTSPMPWPEALIPFQSGGTNNGWQRGAVVSNLFVSPLIVFIISISYGIYKTRDVQKRQAFIAASLAENAPGAAGADAAGASGKQKTSSVVDSNNGAKKPLRIRLKEWYYLTFCEWLYHGSTVTCLTLTFAAGFDGTVSAAAMAFATKTESSDSAGDFMAVLLYIIIVGVFFHRTATTLFLSTPARFFVTPGALRKKPGKRPKRKITPWLGDLLDSQAGAWFVTGYWVWRCSSAKTWRQLREVQCLFRRFHGPTDEDRAALAEQVRKKKAEEHGVTMTLSMSESAFERHEMEQEQQAAAAAAAASSPAKDGTDNDDESTKGETDQKEETDPNKDPKDDAVKSENSTEKVGDSKKSKDKKSKAQKKKQPATAGKPAASSPTGPGCWDKTKLFLSGVNWTLLFRRLCCTCFFFLEFIGVFFVALFKGVARVSEDPDKCHSLAIAAAVFLLFHFVFILIVRPFLVPVRNILAVASALLSVAAHFLAAENSTESKQSAVDMALLAAVIPLFAFVFTAIPRLLMRFVWGLQHAPGRRIPLVDPVKKAAAAAGAEKKPPTAAEIHKKKEETRKQLAAARGEIFVPLLPPAEKESASAAALREKQEEEEHQEKSAEEIHAERMLASTAGPLTKLSRLFFPPPPRTYSGLRRRSVNRDRDGDGGNADDDDEEDAAAAAAHEHEHRHYQDSFDGSDIDEEDVNAMLEDENDDDEEEDIAKFEFDDSDEDDDEDAGFLLRPPQIRVPVPSGNDSSVVVPDGGGYFSMSPSARSSSPSPTVQPKSAAATSAARTRQVTLEMEHAARRVQELQKEVERTDQHHAKTTGKDVEGIKPVTLTNLFSPAAQAAASSPELKRSSGGKMKSSSSGTDPFRKPATTTTPSSASPRAARSSSPSPNNKDTAVSAGRVRIQQEVALATLLSHVVDKRQKIEDM